MSDPSQRHRRSSLLGATLTLAVLAAAGCSPKGDGNAGAPAPQETFEVDLSETPTLAVQAAEAAEPEFPEAFPTMEREIATLAPTLTPSGEPIPRPSSEGMLEPVRRLLAHYRVGVETAPKSAAAWFAYAVVLDAHRLFDEAATCYGAASDLQPGGFVSAYLRASALDFAGAPDDEVESAYRRALGLKTDYAPSVLRLGVFLLKRDRHAEAIDVLTHALTLDPDFAWAHRTLGQAHAAKGQLDKAVQHLEEAASLEPKDAMARLELARVLQELGREDEAEEWMARAEGLDRSLGVPDPLRFRVEQRSLLPIHLRPRAREQLTAGDFAAALQSYSTLAEEEPDSAATQHDLARCQVGLGRTDLAVQHLRRAIELDPERLAARWDLLNILGARGDVQSAVEVAKELVEADPENPQAKLALAMAMARSGQLDEALTAFQQAEAAGASGAALDHDWGMTFMLAGRPAEAEARFRRALKENPDLLDTRYSLALAVSAQGRRDEAIRELRKVVAANPQHQAARELAALEAATP